MGTHTKYLAEIGEEALKDILKENYNLRVTNFSPVLVGEMGESYVVAGDTEKYFLKILHKNKIDSVKNLEATLALTAFLKKSGIEEIGYPIPSLSGELKISLENYYLVLQNYIDATSLQSLETDDITKIAEIVAKIHGASIIDLEIEEETYGTEYADLLLKQLAVAEKEDGVWPKAVRDLLLPHKSRLEADLERLHFFSAQTSSTKKTLVITHGDLILNNILKDKAGKIYIVDWDMAKLALPERDLWFFAKDNGVKFLSAYQKLTDYSIDKNVMSFFLYKRYLEDIVYWLEEILTTDVSDQQKQADLEGIRISCLEFLR